MTHPTKHPPGPRVAPTQPALLAVSALPVLPALFALFALFALLAANPAQAQTAPPGRLLASNCFQCHGTNGKGPGFDRLAGKSANELYEEMKSFQSGKEGENIMARHVRGYTDAQLRQMAQWLSTQR